MKTIKIQPSIATFLFFFLLIGGAQNMQGQASLYFEYNPACMTKLDYEREGKFHDIPFTDYVLKTAPNEKVIFRVKKIAINKTVLPKLPQKTWTCTNSRKITPNMIKGINQFKAIAYIVVPLGNKYELLEVNSVATLEEKNNQIKYESGNLSFTYRLDNKSTELNLNTKSTDKNVFYQKEEKLKCYPQYGFNVVYKSSSASPYQFDWVKGLGFKGIYTPSGKMKLVSIDNQTMNDYLVRACGIDPTIPAVANSNVSPYADTTKPSSTDILSNSKNKTPKIDENIAVNPYASTTYSTMSASSSTNGINQNSSATNNNNTAPSMSTPTNNNNSSEAGTAPYSNSTTPYANTNVNLVNRTYTAVNGYYTVQEDDNLYEISTHFNLPITRLMEINGLKSYEIDRNQLLKVVDNGTVPHVDKNPIIQKNLATKQQLTIHVVEQGENLYRIAQKYGLTLTQLFQLNNLQSNDIDIDQRLIVGIQTLP